MKHLTAIEIRNDENSEDYDSYILSAYRILYNDLNLPVPLNKLTVRVLEKDKLSQNTKNFIEDRFAQVEYLNEIQKVNENENI